MINMSITTQTKSYDKKKSGDEATIEPVTSSPIYLKAWRFVWNL